MDEEKLFKSLKSNLKGLVLSEKNGYTTKRLCEHYRELIGQDLVNEINKLRFSSISSFLKSLNDIMERGYNENGEEVYRGVADESTNHMAKLISKTPVNKKKQTSGRGGSRGREPFAYLGSRGRMGVQGRTNDPGEQHYVPKPLPGFTGFGGPRNGKPNVVGGCFLGNLPKASVEKAANVNTGPFRTQDTKDGCFKNILEQYFAKHNLGSPPFQVSGLGDHWMASVWVNCMEFCHVEAVGGEAAAVEAVSKLCVNKLNILEKAAEMDNTDDWATTVAKVEQLLEGKTGGVFSTIIDKLYEKKYRKQLPSSWWEAMDGVRAEPLSAGSKIMIIFPESSSHKSQTNDSEAVKSPEVESSSLVTSPPTVTDYQPSLHTSIIPEENQTENKLSLEQKVLENGKLEEKLAAEQVTPEELKTGHKFGVELPALIPPSEDLWDVYVKFVASPDQVHVRFFGADYSDKFDEVSEGMDTFYESSDVPDNLEVEVGRMYAALVDDGWHRVEVKELVDSGAARCLFFDFGDEDVLDREDLRDLHPTFLTIPAQAFKVSLNGIPNIEDETIMERLNEMLIDKAFVAQVVVAESNSKCPSVVLFDTSSEVCVNINRNIMDQYEAALMTSTANSSTVYASGAECVLRAPSKDSFEEELSVELSDTAVSPPLDNTVVSPALDSAPVSPPLDSATNLNATKLPALNIPPVGELFDVKVAWAASPSSFIVQPTNWATQLLNLMESMQSFYNDSSTKKSLSGDVSKGDILAVLHDDGLWYRGEVVRLLSPRCGVWQVRLVDYGRYSLTSHANLQPLLPELTKLPRLAILARLAGARPSKGHWTQEDIGWFNDRVTGKQFQSRVKKVTAPITDGESQELGMELVLIDTSRSDEDKFVAKELMER